MNCQVCGKPAVCKIDMRPEWSGITYYCMDHLPTGWSGVIPDENKVVEA